MQEKQAVDFSHPSACFLLNKYHIQLLKLIKQNFIPANYKPIENKMTASTTPIAGTTTVSAPNAG